MTTWGNAELLVEMLDRQLQFLDGQGHERRVLLLPRWLKFIAGEPQLAGLTAELTNESNTEFSDLTRADHAIRERLASLWRQHEADVRLDLDGVKDESLFAFGHFDAFVDRVTKRPMVKISEQTHSCECLTETTGLVSALLQWSQWSIEKRKEEEGVVPVELLTLVKVAKAFETELQFLQREFSATCENLAGVAFNRIESLVRRANPRPPNYAKSASEAELGEQLFELVVFQRTNGFASLLHGESGSSEWASMNDIREAAEQAAKDVHLITHELQVRLLAGRSRLALVRRYAARCESFDAESLRKLAAANPGNAERALTLDFAKYLFGEGLNPVLDPTIGGLRPDVIASLPGLPLYAEAKQYGSDCSPRTKITAAYRQVWSTWGRLSNVHHVAEAFLVVFRIGGPRAELPEQLRYRGRVLYSVLVDISVDGGSRDKHSTISFDAGDLLPRQDELASGALDGG